MDFVKRFFAVPRNVLCLGVGIGALMLLFLILANPPFYRDSSAYVSMASAFKFRLWDMAFLPTLPVFGTLASGFFTWIGIPPQTASLLASGLFTILIIIPLYKLLCCFFEPRHAAWGAFIGQFTPRIMRFGLAPLLDGYRWFFFPLALYFVFRYHNKRDFMSLVWLSFCCAALSLARGEGILFAAMLMLVLAILLCCNERHRFLGWSYCRQAFATVAMVFLMTIVLISPRLVQMYRLTGYPGIETRQISAIASIVSGVVDAISPEDANRERKPLLPYKRGVRTLTTSRLLNAEFQSRFWQGFFNGFYLLYLPLSILGIWLLTQRDEWELKHTVLVALVVMNSAVHMAMQAAASRYFLINSQLFLPFTLAGFLEMRNYLLRKRLGGFVFTIAATTIIGSQAVASIRISDRYRVHETGAYLRLMRPAGSWRSGLSRPLALLIGPDYGWGHYAHINTTRALNPYYNLLESPGLATVLETGVPPNARGYFFDPRIKAELIMLDMVIITRVEEHKAAVDLISRNEMWIERPDIPGSRAVKIFIHKAAMPIDR